MCKHLDPNEILSREFEYAAQAAFQAHEDRANVFNYYLATAGTLIAVVALVDPASRLHLGLAGLVFGALAVLGLTCLLQLAKLRLAWADSVRTMCRIKEHYIRACADAQLAKAFRWKTETIPTLSKKWSVAFLRAVTIALLSSGAAGGAVVFGGLAATGEFWLIPGLAVALAGLAAQVVTWVLVCREKRILDTDSHG